MSAIDQDFTHSEATRLLCAGTYFDPEFRRRTVEELVEHEERPVAPSIGYDVLPVLAHALRARRWEAATGLAVLAVWAGFAVATFLNPLPSPIGGPYSWPLTYAAISGLLWIEHAAARQGMTIYDRGRASWTDRTPLLTYGIIGAALMAAPRLLALSYWSWFIASALAEQHIPWHAAAFPLLLALPVWIHRVRIAALMRQDLSRSRFPRTPRPKLPATRRYQRIGAAIDREQHSTLATYSPFRPLVGLGLAYDAWAITIALQHKKPGPAHQAPSPGNTARLNNREVIDLIRRKVGELRRPSAQPSRDRLQELKIDEFLCQPVQTTRAAMPYDPNRIRESLHTALDDTGEQQRHFLRVRIAAWSGQLVVCVLVRVHTQGGMLVLEVAPHVLPPVRDDLESAANTAAGIDRHLLRDGARALISSPAASFAAIVSLLRTTAAMIRTWLVNPASALPDGPRIAVRELGGAQQVTLFHEMDISRYVKTVFEQISTGVLEALRIKGYDTGEFEQQIVNVERGGIYIGEMSGGVASTGARAHITQYQGGHREKRRPERPGRGRQPS